VVRGPASLLHRGGGQRREADDLAHRVDVLDLGLEVLVDLDLAPVGGRHARRLHVQLVGDALPPASGV